MPLSEHFWTEPILHLHWVSFQLFHDHCESNTLMFVSFWCICTNPNSSWILWQELTCLRVLTRQLSAEWESLCVWPTSFFYLIIHAICIMQNGKISIDNPNLFLWFLLCFVYIWILCYLNLTLYYDLNENVQDSSFCQHLYFNLLLFIMRCITDFASVKILINWISNSLFNESSTTPSPPPPPHPLNPYIHSC